MLQSHLQQNYSEVKQKIPANVTLVAVSKTHPSSAIQELYNLGQRHFGENRVQELLEKQEELPQDIQWHLIGHLQTNKVRQIAPFVSLIESVDSEKLLAEIDRQGKLNDRKINVLLQIKIASEDTKSGMNAELAGDLLKKYADGLFANVKVRGLMGMATFTENVEQIKREFETLNHHYEQWKDQFHFDILSMGMSGDYLLALECGSNSVRVGSAIFGIRD